MSPATYGNSEKTKQSTTINSLPAPALLSLNPVAILEARHRLKQKPHWCWKMALVKVELISENQSKEKYWIQFRRIMHYYGLLWILCIISCKVKRLKRSLTSSCIISPAPNNVPHLIMFTVDTLSEKCAAVLLRYSFPHYYFINIWLTVIAAD